MMCRETPIIIIHIINCGVIFRAIVVGVGADFVDPEILAQNRTGFYRDRHLVINTPTTPSLDMSTFIMDEESPDCYVRGGLHAVHLHDEYHNGRYRVLRKLGHGRYSTVWLVRDQQYVSPPLYMHGI